MATLIQRAKDGIDHNREMTKQAHTEHGKGKWSLICLRWHKRRRDFCRIAQVIAEEGIGAAINETRLLIAELEGMEATVKDKSNRSEWRGTEVELVETDLYDYGQIEQRLETLRRGIIYDEEIRCCV